MCSEESPKEEGLTKNFLNALINYFCMKSEKKMDEKNSKEIWIQLVFFYQCFEYWYN